MQQQPAHPAILAAITVARMLEETRLQQLIAALDNRTLSLADGPLQVQHLLRFSAAESRSIVSLFRQWQTWDKDSQSLTVTLQAVHVACATMQSEAPAVSLVWTGPVSLPGPTRTTSSVLIDLIDHAQQEIVVVGYTLAPTARSIIEHLAQALERGVQVVMIVDRMEEKKQLDALHACWPKKQNWPSLYTRQASISDAKSALHAKVIVVDSRALLATSANLSYHGLAGNIELGLLVEGRVAFEAVTLLKSLIIDEIFVKVDDKGK